MAATTTETELKEPYHLRHKRELRIPEGLFIRLKGLALRENRSVEGMIKWLVAKEEERNDNHNRD